MPHGRGSQRTRATVLAAECGGDAVLRREVESLLAQPTSGLRRHDAYQGGTRRSGRTSVLLTWREKLFAEFLVVNGALAVAFTWVDARYPTLTYVIQLTPGF
jgi:hypothetical protein